MKEHSVWEAVATTAVQKRFESGDTEVEGQLHLEEIVYVKGGRRY